MIVRGFVVELSLKDYSDSMLLGYIEHYPQIRISHMFINVDVSCIFIVYSL